MLRIQLKEGASVFTSTGEEVGKINRFVLNPETNEVTHVVVQKGGLLSEDKVVPFDMVSSATEDRVVLNENTEAFEELPPFEETHYVQATHEGTGARMEEDVPSYQSAPSYYWYPPYGYTGFPAFGLHYPALPRTTTEQNIPDETVSLREGTNVMSSDDKHVGDVERLFIEQTSNKVTHFLISQGLLFKERKLVPVNWIRTVTEDEVELAVPAEVLERLPSYEGE